MKNFLNNLQNKPEPIKRLIMWFGVFMAMAVIFTFWLLNFSSQIAATKNDETAANLNKELPGVWQSLKGQLNNFERLWQK